MLEAFIVSCAVVLLRAEGVQGELGQTKTNSMASRLLFTCLDERSYYIDDSGDTCHTYHWLYHVVWCMLTTVYRYLCISIQWSEVNQTLQHVLSALVEDLNHLTTDGSETGERVFVTSVKGFLNVWILFLSALLQYSKSEVMLYVFWTDKCRWLEIPQAGLQPSPACFHGETCMCLQIVLLLYDMLCVCFSNSCLLQMRSLPWKLGCFVSSVEHAGVMILQLVSPTCMLTGLKWEILGT